MKFPKFKLLAALVLSLALGKHGLAQTTVLSATGDGGGVWPALAHDVRSL